MAAAVVLAVALTACGGGSEVGEEVDVGVTGGADRGAIDAPTTSTSRPEATPTTGAVVATTPPTAATTTTQAAAAVTIAINPDTGAAPQFEPSFVRAFVGTTVRWVNQDSVPRSVVAGDGSWDSGEIAPGGEFEYRADVPGRFDYADGTRPYAVATLEVVAR